MEHTLTLRESLFLSQLQLISRIFQIRISTILVFFLISAISVPSLIAQCTITVDNGGTSSITSTASKGQTFKATCSGTLNTISVIGAANTSGHTVTVYSGAGTSGTQLGQLTGQSITEETSSLTNFATVFDFSGEGISITSGDTYTFIISGAIKLFLHNTPSTAYADGIMYFDGGAQSGFDLNFKVDISAAAATSTDSDIIVDTSLGKSSNFNPTTFDAADLDNTGNDELEIGRFTLRDGGSGTDSDSDGTELTSVTLNFSNHANIARVALWDGSSELGEGTVPSGSITFSGISTTAADDGTQTLKVFATFKDDGTITDGEAVAVTIDVSTLTTGSGSELSSSFTGGADLQDSPSSDQNRIEVTATTLSFSTDATNTEKGSNMTSPQVEIVDADGNRDTDNTAGAGTISITSTGTLDSSPKTASLTSGVATFNDILHTAIGTGRQLTASDGNSNVTNGQSSTFNINDTTNPTFNGGGSTPSDNSTGVSVSDNIVLDFSESIQKGTGNITLKIAGGADVQNFSSQSATNTNSPAAGAMGILGDKVYLNPTSDLLGETAYAIRIVGTAIDDLAGNSFAGISNDTDFNFTTVAVNAAPSIAIDNGTLAYTENGSATQIDGAGTVSDSDGDSDWDGGTLEVQITANNEAADEISISDTDGDGTTITISSTNVLANGTDVGDLSTSGGTVTNGTKLTITFDSDATNAIVQEVLQSLRYRNTSDAPGTSNRTITITATDKNAGTANDTRTVSVTAQNDAPVLDAAQSPTLTAINEDAGDDDGSGADGDDDATSNANNQGSTVASIVVDGSITDADGSAVEAIAITNVDNTNGVWQYSTDNGSNWNNFSGTTGSTVDIESSARLLDGTNANHKVRFVPNANYNGTATFTFRAWDKSTGTGGSTADASSNGTTTAFSTATDNASITVNSVNDEPTFTIGANQTVSQSAGAQTVNSFISTFDDGDSDATQITQFNITNNTNAGLFSVVPAISASGTLTYTPLASAFGQATISVTISDNGGTTNGGDDTSASQDFKIFVTPDGVKINEVDADDDGSDDAEFVEIFNNSGATINMNGLVLVYFNGGDQLSSGSSNDLDGNSLANNDFFVVGMTGVTNLDLDKGASAFLQNDAEAVALYVGDGTDFADNTSITTDGLVDVLVYGPNNGERSSLATAFGGVTPADDDATTTSLSRIPDGSGTFQAETPSPGATNVLIADISNVSLSADNSYIDVTFDEAVYNTNGGNGALEAADFSLAITGGTATSPTISSVKKNDNTAEGSATALAGGETVIRIFFSLTGTPSGAETLTVTPVSNQIFDASGNASSTTQSNNTATMNDKTAPTVTSVSSTKADGTLKANDCAVITVTFSEAVTVVGSPTLKLETGTTDQTINPNGDPFGSGTTTLQFLYCVIAGESSADLEYFDVNSLTAGTSIKDAAGNDAVLTLPTIGGGNSLSDNKALVVDGVAPTVSSVSATTANGSYNAGDVIAVTVTFSEAVAVTGTPQLELETGTTDRTVNYASGSGGTTLTFNYTVQAGDENTDLDYTGTTALSLNSGTIKDGAGNAATLTLATPGASNSLGANKGLVIDTTAPTVTNVTSSTSDGTKGAGDVVSIQVTFSENIIVTGTPQLELALVGGNKKVDYVSTSTNTMTFTYTVATGDESADLDYTGTGALTLNSGTIKDAAGNGATLTLAAPGVATSLGNNKALVISAFPTVTLSVDNSSINEASGTATLTATLSAVSTQDVAVTIAYSGDAVNGTDYNNTASTTITVSAGQSSADAGVIITPVNDANPEGNETITAEITGVTKGTENGTQSLDITIIDDDTPNVSFTSTSSNGAESVSSAAITVDLSLASTPVVTVDYTVSGTATAGTDFTLADGTLTFASNDIQETISISSIVDDAILEANETVIITLSNPTNANLGTNKVHTYTINDNDNAAVTIVDVSGSENGGAITFTATLDNAVEGGFDVDVSSADGTAATGDSDYGAIANTTLRFSGSANETKTFTVTPTNDDKLEADETFTVGMNNLANTTLSIDITDGATGTITNDDAAAVTFSDVTANEADGTATITLTLDNQVDGNFSLGVSTSDNTANASSDYTSLTAESVTFDGNAGETETVQVTLTNDNTEEQTETLNIGMGGLSGTTLAVNISDTGVLTITDDDDQTAPSGYTVTLSDELIGGSELTTTKFTFAGAEVGSTYNYTVSSSVGGTPVTGTGTIATATDEITLSDLSGLTDGTLTLSVTLTDGASNTSTAQTDTSVKDATAPAAPSVSSITSDSGVNGADQITNDQTLSFNGTAEANATVEVFIGGTSIGTTTTDGSGNFSFDHSSTTLAEGNYNITAQATDAAGNTGTISSALAITIDTSAPSAPSVLSITTDSGASTTDGTTNDNTLSFNGTAEANATVEVFIGGTSIGTTTADGSGNFSFDHTSTTLSDAAYSVTAKATDAAGNQSAESAALTVTVDTTPPTLSISAFAGDDVVDILEQAADQTLSGTSTGLQQGAQVTLGLNGKNYTATVDGSGAWSVTVPAADAGGIDETETITADATDVAGNTAVQATRNITRQDASVITSVAVPSDGTYKIGDALEFTVNFSLPITSSGNVTLPITIGATNRNVAVKAHASNSAALVFSYTIVEGEVDTDGIDLGTAITIDGSGAFVRDEFNTAAILTLNNVASSANVKVDGVKPTPTLSTTADDLVNGAFTVNFAYDEAVSGFELGDISVTNGTASNFTAITAGREWSASISPSSDGAVSVNLPAGIATDTPGNASNASSNTVTKTFDGTAPLVASITRKDGNPISTSTTSVDFTVVFTEDVSGVDITDFELNLSGPTATLNSVTSVDAKTYTVNVNGISGEGTIGVNAKDDDTILDNAGNPLGGTFTTGETYTTNFAPTDILIDSDNIDENNAQSDQVGTLSTANPDAEDNNTFSLVSGTGDDDNGSFLIAADGLFAGTVFDHENKDSYSIRVKVDDGQGASFEKALTITINDVNEVSTDMTLSNDEIDEADESVLVGTMSTTDVDDGDTFEYSLVQGTGDNNNLLFQFTGNELRTAGATNFEDGATLSIRVRVTDSGGLTYDEVFSITVNDVVIEPLRNFTTNEPDAGVKNFFTPNGDGTNETWIVEDILDNPINEVKVYSQAGKLIFSQRNYQNDWDGTFDGEPIPPGTYYYEINVYNGESIIRGFLTIIRD